MWTPLLTPLLQFLGLLITGLVGLLITWVLHKQTIIKLTAAQQATIQSNGATLAGLLVTELSKGVMQLADLHPSNPRVMAISQLLIAGAPMEAAALGITPDGAANIVLGQVGKLLSADPTVPTLGSTADSTVAMPTIPVENVGGYLPPVSTASTVAVSAPNT